LETLIDLVKPFFKGRYQDDTQGWTKTSKDPNDDTKTIETRVFGWIDDWVTQEVLSAASKRANTFFNEFEDSLDIAKRSGGFAEQPDIGAMEEEDDEEPMKERSESWKNVNMMMSTAGGKTLYGDEEKGYIQRPISPVKDVPPPPEQQYRQVKGSENKAPTVRKTTLLTPLQPWPHEKFSNSNPPPPTSSTNQNPKHPSKPTTTATTSTSNNQ
jgi:hypothetical protein